MFFFDRLITITKNIILLFKKNALIFYKLKNIFIIVVHFYCLNVLLFGFLPYIIIECMELRVLFTWFCFFIIILNLLISEFFQFFQINLDRFFVIFKNNFILFILYVSTCVILYIIFWYFSMFMSKI